MAEFCEEAVFLKSNFVKGQLKGSKSHLNQFLLNNNNNKKKFQKYCYTIFIHGYFIGYLPNAQLQN